MYPGGGRETGNLFGLARDQFTRQPLIDVPTGAYNRNIAISGGGWHVNCQPIILKEFRQIVQKSKSRNYRAFLYKVVTQK